MTKAKDLRQKEEKELKRVLQEVWVELARFSDQQSEGSLKDSSVFGKKRKELARTLTVLKEKEILREVEVEKQSGKKTA